MGKYKRLVSIFIIFLSFFIIRTNVNASAVTSLTAYNMCQYNGAYYWGERPLVFAYSMNGTAVYSFEETVPCSAVGYTTPEIPQGVYDITFIVQLTVDMTYAAPEIQVNSTTCVSEMTGPLYENDTEIAPQLTYTCKGVPVSSGGNFRVIWATSHKSTRPKYYYWLSNIVYEYNSDYLSQQKQDETNKHLQETNDTLKDNNSDEATNEAGSFFSGFETDTFGLTSIVTAPLNLIESITSSTCKPIGLPIPFIEGQTLNLPCLRGIYETNFGTFYDIYKIITFGIVAYYVCVKLFNLVKDFKNPEHDEIEVLEL